MVYKASDVTAHADLGITRGGFILIGLLSGGDYHPGGLPKCGPKLALGLARAGLGDSLLKATQTLTDEQLPAFLDRWREDLCTELRTNASGYLGRKCVALAKSVPDDFPDLQVLRSYTNPITTESEAKRKGTRPKIIGWGLEPNIGKIAGICELYFEWGVKEIIIKRFRTVLWPSVVLRILRKIVLDQDRAEVRSAKTFLAEEEVASTSLLVKIHSSRMHATTGKLLEYRLEIAPLQLVTLAADGVKGTRQLPDADSAYDLTEDEDDEGGRAGKKAPPEPDSALRVWLPACMVEKAHPELVRAFEEKEAGKLAKKAGKGKGRAGSAPPASQKARKPQAFPMALSQEPAASEEPAAPNEQTPPPPPPGPPPKPAARRKTPAPSSSQTSRVAALFSDGPSAPRMKEAIPEEEGEPSDIEVPLPRAAPFPLSKDGDPSVAPRAFSRIRSSPAVLPSPSRPMRTKKPAPFPTLRSPPSRTRELELDPSSNFDDHLPRANPTMPSFFGAQKWTNASTSKKTRQPNVGAARPKPTTKHSYIELSDSDGDALQGPHPIAPRAASRPLLSKPASEPVIPSAPPRSKSAQRTLSNYLEKAEDSFAMDISVMDVDWLRAGTSRSDPRSEPPGGANTSEDSSLGSRAASRRSPSPQDMSMCSPSSSLARAAADPPARFSFSPVPRPTKPRASEFSIISISSEDEEIPPLVRAKMNVARKLAAEKQARAPQRKLDGWVCDKPDPAASGRPDTRVSARVRIRKDDIIDLT
jgi:hypothetical protein